MDNLTITEMKEVLKQIIVMICYNPDFPQDAKTALLNKADECGIKFDTDL